MLSEKIWHSGSLSNDHCHPCPPRLYPFLIDLPVSSPCLPNLAEQGAQASLQCTAVLLDNLEMEEAGVHGPDVNGISKTLCVRPRV